MNLKERAKKLKTDIPAIFLALKDKETPIVAKIVGGLMEGWKAEEMVLCNSDCGGVGIDYFAFGRVRKL